MLSDIFYDIIASVISMNENIIYRQKGKDPYYKIWHTPHKNMIIYMYSDGGSIVCKEKIYPIKKGSLCFVGAEKFHYTMPDTPDSYERSKIFISTDELQKLLALLPENSPLRNVFNDEAIVYAHIEDDAPVEQQFEEISSCTNSEYALPMLYSCFMKLLILLHKNAGENVIGSSKGMYKAIEYINSHIYEDISIDNICSAVHISKYHFCRQFKKATGLTVMEYILKTRIVIAKNMLLKEKITITEISSRCGFSSVSYFSRIFKKETGMTPLKYRKNKNAGQ